MASYRVEAWLYHKDPDFQDQLEKDVEAALKDAGIGVVEGPVVFRIYPNGEPGPGW